MFSHDAAQIMCYSQTCVKQPYTIRYIFGFSDRWLLIASFSNKQPPVNSDFQFTCMNGHLNRFNIFLAFQTGGCLLLHELFLHYIHLAISNHLSRAISRSPEWMVP